MSAPAAGLDAAVRGRVGTFDIDVAFTAPVRGVTALFGPSGCGKTSVLRCLAGLLHLPGHVAVNGQKWQDTTQKHFVPPHRREVGYVFQEASLFPHLSVRDNLLFGAHRAVGRKSAEGGLADIVDLLGIGHLLGRSPTTLSGGERQRVALGRALLSRPRLLLMDEPLSALDRMTKENILPFFERIVETVDLPIVYVSHDVTEVARLARRVVVMEAGRVVRTGETADVLAAADMFPEEAGALLETTIAHQHEDGLTELTFSGGALHLPRVEGAHGAKVRIRIQAQDVMIALSEPKGMSALNVLRVTIADIRRTEGPSVLMRLRCGSDHILARVTERSLKTLGLEEGTAAFAVVKSVAIARRDVGTPHGPPATVVSPLDRGRP